MKDLQPCWDIGQICRRCFLHRAAPSELQGHVSHMALQHMRGCSAFWACTVVTMRSSSYGITDSRPLVAFAIPNFHFSCDGRLRPGRLAWLRSKAFERSGALPIFICFNRSALLFICEVLTGRASQRSLGRSQQRRLRHIHTHFRARSCYYACTWIGACRDSDGFALRSTSNLVCCLEVLPIPVHP